MISNTVQDFKHSCQSKFKHETKVKRHSTISQKTNQRNKTKTKHPITNFHRCLVFSVPGPNCSLTLVTSGIPNTETEPNNRHQHVQKTTVRSQRRQTIPTVKQVTDRRAVRLRYQTETKKSDGVSEGLGSSTPIKFRRSHQGYGSLRKRTEVPRIRISLSSNHPWNVFQGCGGEVRACQLLLWLSQIVPRSEPIDRSFTGQDTTDKTNAGRLTSR